MFRRPREFARNDRDPSTQGGGEGPTNRRLHNGWRSVVRGRSGWYMGRLRRGTSGLRLTVSPGRRGPPGSEDTSVMRQRQVLLIERHDEHLAVAMAAVSGGEHDEVVT